jgi:hypothetical protein
MRELLPDLETVVPAHGPAGHAQSSISWMITYLHDLYGNVKALWDCGASAREAVAVCMMSCAWSAPPSLSAAAVDYDFQQPGAGLSYLAGLAASLHRSGIVATYRWLERRAGRRLTGPVLPSAAAPAAASGGRCNQAGGPSSCRSYRPRGPAGRDGGARCPARHAR